MIRLYKGCDNGCTKGVIWLYKEYDVIVQRVDMVVEGCDMVVQRV